MTTQNTSPLDDNDDLRRAVSEATEILEDAPKPDTPEDRRLTQLLSWIAQFHDEQPTPLQQANLDRLQDLEKHLRAYGRKWCKTTPSGSEHWSPTLGSDIDPDHVRH